MPIFHIDDSDDPRLTHYRNVPEPELVRSAGLFVAEGRLVVRRLLRDARLKTRSLMVTSTALAALEDLPVPDLDLPVYVVPQAVMNGVTGFNIHRGCLALGERPAVRDWRELWSGGAARVVVLERIGNADNVGSIFRSAAALGAGAVLLNAGCADPLYRKAIRTSMGASLSVPFAEAAPWPAMLDELRSQGVAVIALTPDPAAVPLRQAAAAVAGRTVAIVLGHEGDGLSAATLERADYRARIAMSPGADSLNVATAAAIALYELRSHG